MRRARLRSALTVKAMENGFGIGDDRLWLNLKRVYFPKH